MICKDNTTIKSKSIKSKSYLKNKVQSDTNTCVSKEVWIEYIERDKPIDMRNKIAEQNMNLVYKIAWLFVGSFYRDKKNIRDEFFADIVNEGTIGLIKAIETFNPDKAQFSTFAHKYIHGSIAQYLRDRCYAIRFSQVKCERLKRISKKILIHHQKLGNGKGTLPSLLTDKPRIEQYYKAILPSLSEKDQISFDEFYNDFKEYLKTRNVVSCYGDSEFNSDYNRFDKIASRTYPSFKDWVLSPIHNPDVRVKQVINKLMSYK